MRKPWIAAFTRRCPARTKEKLIGASRVAHRFLVASDRSCELVSVTIAPGSTAPEESVNVLRPADTLRHLRQD